MTTHDLSRYPGKRPGKIPVFLCSLLISALCGWPSPALHAADMAPGEAASAQHPLTDELQTLKTEVLKVNRELFMIEEDILYPGSTQFTVFVSLDVGEYFELDSVQLRIDDKIVANYLYTRREVAALREGGVQRLYQGNLKSGKHEITAFFIGKGPHDRDYKRATSHVVDKDLTPLYAELKIVDDPGQQQPDFSVAVWDQ